MKAFLLILVASLCAASQYGIMHNPKILEQMKANSQKYSHVPQSIDYTQLPKNFDGRKVWPNCIHPVLDQGACGSCWAFAASEVLSDRFCIFSNGTVNVVLSPQNLLSCEELNLGCSLGSLPFWAFDYTHKYGITSMECTPYVSGSGTVPACNDAPPKCTGNGAFHLYKSNRTTHCGDFTDPSRHTQAIMSCLTQGPVDATFNVWSDFYNYRGGVYKHQSGTYDGLHSVKIIGWGVDEASDEPYWLVQNSWGPTWGPYNGFFKILRGADECFIESLVYTADPMLS